MAHVVSSPFELRYSLVSDSAIVEVIGEADMATSPELTLLIQLLGDNPRRVVVDMTETNYFDSAMLHTLIGCQRLLAEQDISLAVVSPGNRLARTLFEVTRLTEALSVSASVADALAARPTTWRVAAA